MLMGNLILDRLLGAREDEAVSCELTAPSLLERVVKPSGLLRGVEFVILTRGDAKGIRLLVLLFLTE